MPRKDNAIKKTVKQVYTQTTLNLGKAASERLCPPEAPSVGGSPSYAKKLRRANATQHKFKVGRVYCTGKTAAQAGRPLASQEKLMKRNGYTIEEAREYVRGYKDYQSTSEIQKMRKARNLALRAIYMGNICANKNEVLKKYPNFAENEIKVYLKVIAEQNPSKETLVWNKARQDARLAARRHTHKGVAETAKNTKTRVYVKSYDEVVRRKGDQEAIAVEALVLLSKEKAKV
jgi:hypothetical protein